MPDHRGRVKAERETVLAKSPADVDVVARDSEGRVEAADRFQGGAPKRHVAPRNVLGLAVREQHVQGPTGRPRDALRDGVLAPGRNVRSPDGGVRGVGERVRDVLEPVRIGARVVVDEGDDLSVRAAESGVSGGREPPASGADDRERVGGGELCSRVG